MTRRRQAMALLALVGLLLAIYLWLYKIGVVGTLQCGAGGGPCEVVQASRYADVFGVPVALIGVAGYAALLVVGLVGLQPAFAASRRVSVLLAALASVGFAFTLYLTYVELFVLHAICRWCIVSALIMTAIWVLAVKAFFRSRTSSNEFGATQGPPAQR